jgi:hypothetical protein
MAIGQRGYVGLVRREDGALNLAAAFDRAVVKSSGGVALCGRRRSLSKPALPLPRSLESSRWQLTPALTRRAGLFAGDRFLLLGDATGYVEPFTGEGMAWALAAGAAVAPFVEEAQGEWSADLERRWQRRLVDLTISRQRVCSVLSTLLRQPLTTNALFSLGCQWPSIPQRVIRSLNQVSPPDGELLIHASHPSRHWYGGAISATEPGRRRARWRIGSMPKPLSRQG